MGKQSTLHTTNDWRRDATVRRRGVARTRPSHNPRGLSTASRGRRSQTRQTRRASLFPGTSTRAWGPARKSASARWVPGGHPDGRPERLVRGGCARSVRRRSTAPTRRALPALMAPGGASTLRRRCPAKTGRRSTPQHAVKSPSRSPRSSRTTTRASVATSQTHRATSALQTTVRASGWMWSATHTTSALTRRWSTTRAVGTTR